MSYRNNLITETIFTFFDTETTGNNKNGDDKPIELAYLQWNLKEGLVENVKSYLINPLKYIHPSAIAVHGLFDEDVENAPTLDKVMPKFMDDIGGSTLVAHNIDFDLDMLPELKELDNIKIDSLKLVRKIYKIGDIGYKGHALYSHKSQELRYWLNLKVDTNGLPAHRAGADIIVTKEIFEIVLREVLEKHNFQTLGELENFINQPNVVDKINFGKFNDKLIKDVVNDEFKSSRYKNYFTWLFKEIYSGKMKIDPDVQYSIEQELIKNNIDIKKIII